MDNSVKKCRACLKNSTRTLPLNKNVIGCNPKATYSQLLHDYAKLQSPAKYEHLMPQNLCILCCRELRNSYTFIRQAQYCNDKLINLIAQQLPKLQENTIVLQHNKNELEKSIEKALEENHGKEFKKNHILRNTLMKDFRVVSTSMILKSEVLEEPTESNGSLDSYIEENEEEKSNDNDATSDIFMPEELKESADIYHRINKNVTDANIVNDNCPICKKAIGGRNNFKTHMRVQHDIEPEFLSKQAQEEIYYAIDEDDIIVKQCQQRNKVINCRSCNYVARTYAALNIHNRSKHCTEEKKFKCKFCPYVCLKKFILLMHVRNSHIELIRSLKTDSQNKMDQRETFDNDNNTTNVNFAKTEGNIGNESSSSDYINPLPQNIITPPLKSTLAIEVNEEASSDEMFIRLIKKRQSRISAKSLPRRCDECGNIYNNFGALKTHQKNVHISEEKYRLCPHCGKQFKGAGSLRVHIKNNHVPKKFTGSVIQTVAKGKEKRFMCSHCSYICATSTMLTIHVNRHHTFEKPYKCDICYKSFVLPFDLKIHRYLHTGERPYKCLICSKSFRCSAHLMKHKRIHNNERPYKCHDCGKSFTQSYNLTLHKRSHLKEKQLYCNTCEKVFENRSLLNIHLINENHHYEVV